MCMMMAAAEVRSTNIFATHHAGKQVLVYEAAISTAESNAMVLPIPVRSSATPVELLDLSAFPSLFDDLKHYYEGPEFPVIVFGGPPGKLEVFTVGSFSASIVPSRADLFRLDDRFRLSSGLDELLAGRYGDWAFVIYQLAPGRHQLHPFGVVFESRYAEHLFYPTLHVHDGAHAPEQANFAHRFYGQKANLDKRERSFVQRNPVPVPPPPGCSYGPRDPWRIVPAMPSFVDLREPLDSASRFGAFPNVDMYATRSG